MFDGYSSYTLKNCQIFQFFPWVLSLTRHMEDGYASYTCLLQRTRSDPLELRVLVK